jgi:hypothetical protein
MRETPVSKGLRAWLVVEVLFGLAAILAVFLFPEQTDTNFAWPAKPPVTAAVMGAFYVSAGALFAGSFFVPSWERLRVIVLPSLVFTATELLVTFLHWDRFKVGTLPFYVWFESYLLPPPIFGLLYWWQQRRSSPVGSGITAPLAPWLRALLLVDGAVLTLLFGAVLVAPGLLVAAGPWPFTPLTARALSGWGISLGLLLLSMAAENDRHRVRLATLMPLALAPALLVQLMRFGAEVRWANPWLLLFLADVALLAALSLALRLNLPFTAGPVPPAGGAGPEAAP